MVAMFTSLVLSLAALLAAGMRAWERHYEAGKCDAVQAQFYQPKPAIELFDTQADPWHVTNLAGRPEQAERMRAVSVRRNTSTGFAAVEA